VLIMRCFCLAMLGLCAAVAGSARFLLGHVRVLELRGLREQKRAVLASVMKIELRVANFAVYRERRSKRCFVRIAKTC